MVHFWLLAIISLLLSVWGRKYLQQRSPSSMASMICSSELVEKSLEAELIAVTHWLPDPQPKCPQFLTFELLPRVFYLLLPLNHCSGPLFTGNPCLFYVSSVSQNVCHWSNSVCYPNKNPPHSYSIIIICLAIFTFCYVYNLCFSSKTGSICGILFLSP